jgi:hypothetical protein
MGEWVGELREVGEIWYCGKERTVRKVVTY